MLGCEIPCKQYCKGQAVERLRSACDQVNGSDIIYRGGVNTSAPRWKKRLQGLMIVPVGGLCMNLAMLVVQLHN